MFFVFRIWILILSVSLLAKPLSFLVTVPLCLSLLLSVLVCGCAGGQQESCGSHSVVRESDKREPLPNSSPLLPCIPQTQIREGWWEGEGGVGTLLYICMSPIPPYCHVCRSGPVLHTGWPPPTHTYLSPLLAHVCGYKRKGG